ncbi:hypothetical protein NE237_016901 [Protea cynaroides]|uniref:Uncharacterized protein n=1 Tax=Protea cynaroides TaxID=273540 RepID=A0A9Q0HIQ8_9MAGN|nr:hypothetical protein NE237_016901 [Protea cynaroides]
MPDTFCSIVLLARDNGLWGLQGKQPSLLHLRSTNQRFSATTKERNLLKLKNVVKLQAAVCGHLVPRQAVVTLSRVQAIVKVQALVCARCAQLKSGPIRSIGMDIDHVMEVSKSKGQGSKEKKNAKGKGQQMRLTETMDNTLIDLLVEEVAKGINVTRLLQVQHSHLFPRH